MASERTLYFHYPWDMTFWGVKAVDRHEALGAHQIPREAHFGPTQLYAPLYDLTDDEVFDYLDELNIPFEPFETDIPCAPEVFAAIESAEWDRKQSLDNFRLRFGFSH
jgi:hypothetical protein